jgi:hypothetical protein
VFRGPIERIFLEEVMKRPADYAIVLDKSYVIPSETQ